MSDLFTRWQQVRDEKNETNDEIGVLIALKDPSDADREAEAMLVKHYNDLYELMDRLEADFTDDDWQAHEAEQIDIRESQRQAWLIENRYGRTNPSGGIADWWTA